MENTSSKGTEFIWYIIVAAVLAVGLYLVKRIIKQERMIHQLGYHLEQVMNKEGEEPKVQPKVVEKIVAKSQAWRPIQEQVKDTVVQVFSQVSQVDLLQPFKTPSQHSSYGSAFFINDQGYLATNAHVVYDAKTIWIQIPSLGKRIIDVEVVGMSPERDLALLKVTDDGLAIIKKELGRVPYLSLGDSDAVLRSDEVMALGYPLGQQSLKSTTGVISGREHNLIQMSAAINPGNSGGPLLNVKGEVVGINSSAILEAQNMGYIIPINDFKNIVSDLYKVPLLRKPFLGVLFNNASEHLTEFLGNPQPGGCYIVEVVKNSTLYKAGVEPGDMLYEINGHRLDVFGEMTVPWSEDKITLVDYVSRLSIGQEIDLTVYRNGKRKEFSAQFSQAELPAVRKVYPGYEPVDYEIIAGMVVMELTINHIQIMGKKIPGLQKYAELQNQVNPSLIITHIFPTSQTFRVRTLTIGSTIREVNGVEVATLKELRTALQEHANDKYLTIRASDNISRASDNVFVVLPLEKTMKEEVKLARDYHYSMTDTVKTILTHLQDKKRIETKRTVTV